MKNVVFVVLVSLAVVQSTEKKRISRQKCEEYSELAKKNACVSEAYPFVGAVGYETEEGETVWGCSGSLISDQYVLTVAHCANDNTLGKIKSVRFGETDLSTPNSNGQTYTISEIIRHPEFKRSSAYNDIALLKLNKSVQFTENIRPGCLYSSEDVLQFHVVGFSFRDSRRIGFSTRKGLLLNENNAIGSKEECTKQFKPSRKLEKGVDFEKQFCTKDGSVSCEINSGGPLLVKDELLSCMQNIAGITDIGSPGICSGLSLNVKISGYIDWIESIVWP